MRSNILWLVCEKFREGVAYLVIYLINLIFSDFNNKILEMTPPKNKGLVTRNLKKVNTVIVIFVRLLIVG